MHSFLKRFSLIFVAFSFLVGLAFIFQVQAQENTQDQKLKELQEQIKQYEEELSRLRSQSATLSNQIAQYDAQIKLASLQIEETQREIELLEGRIDQLETSLDALSRAFSSRAAETYKMVKLGDPLLFLISSPNLSTAVSRFHYLKLIQRYDQDLLVKLQSTQTTYQGQKSDKEDLQKRLEKQKANLDAQKAAKASLLAVTKNDERYYQRLLAQAKSELEAIQSILAGKGVEEEVGKVSEGQRIASIIQGASCNSSGTHLHFMVSRNRSALNPFNYLKGGVDYENCSGSFCSSSDGDLFNPSGSWNWPIAPRIKFLQGYGSTWATKNTWVNRIYQFHNGIDIDSYSSSEVRAVKSGTLYRGSYIGNGGCRLRYVRVHHDDSDLDTYYLHVNY